MPCFKDRQSMTLKEPRTSGLRMLTNLKVQAYGGRYEN